MIIYLKRIIYLFIYLFFTKSCICQRIQHEVSLPIIALADSNARRQ